MLKPKLPQQEQGFTLVEVLVSILIATVFTAVALQGMVIAALFKAKAQQYAEATNWIQEDLENVRYQANQFNKNSTGAIADNTIHNSRCSASTRNDGYGDGSRDIISGSDITTDSNNTDSTKTSSFNNKQYTQRRTTTTYGSPPYNTATPYGSPPYNVLRISYSVSPSSSNSVIATMDTEVIPDAAFQCP